MSKRRPEQDLRRIGEGLRQSQTTALLSQLRGTELADQLTLAREMLFPVAHEFRASAGLTEPLMALKEPVARLSEQLGYFERAAACTLSLTSALENNLATVSCAAGLRAAISDPIFAGSWGGLALRELAFDARALAQRADRICDALTMEFGGQSPQCVLPLMLATQTTMEAAASVCVKASQAWQHSDLAAGHGLDSQGFILHLENTAARSNPPAPAVISVNMALREYAGYAHLAEQPLVLDAGRGGVDLRLVDQIVREASKLREGQPLAVRTQGSEIAAKQLDNTATQALAGACLPGEVTAHPVHKAAL